MTTPAGWYHAEGDPPDTVRYWNGAGWDGGPQPAASGQPGGRLPDHRMYPESSDAILALVLAIGGFAVCQLASPFAIWLAGRERRGIDAGRRDPSNRTVATVAWWLGVIGTALMVLVVIGVIVFFVALGAGVATSERG